MPLCLTTKLVLHPSQNFSPRFVKLGLRYEHHLNSYFHLSWLVSSCNKLIPFTLTHEFKVQNWHKLQPVSYKLQKASIFIAHPEFLLSQLQKCNTQQQLVAMLAVYSQTIKEKSLLPS